MKPWLTVVGVGLNGLDGMASQARSSIAAAELVAGSERLLDAVGVEPDRRFVWPTPFEKGLAHVAGLRGRPVAVLATGDPMHFGVGASLAERVPAAELTVFPAPSAFSLAAARLGWPLQDVVCLSAHGRSPEALHDALRPAARLLVLTRDGDAPREIMRLLVARGYGASRVSVLENLGGPDEKRIDLVAREVNATTFAALNTLAIECIPDVDLPPLPNVPGLPDSAFAHDGQLTKREVRAVTLAGLAPLPGQRLWDVGAGCGSVAIEWMRCVPRGAAVAFERNPERIGMIRRNAASLGAPALAIVEGDLPTSMVDQPAPDAVFHGGAIADDAVFDTCWAVLRPGGRFVANAVTLEGEAALARRHVTFGGELVRLDVAHNVAVGSFRAMKPAMAVTQWRVVKP